MIFFGGVGIGGAGVVILGWFKGSLLEKIPNNPVFIILRAYLHMFDQKNEQFFCLPNHLIKNAET